MSSRRATARAQCLERLTAVEKMTDAQLLSAVVHPGAAATAQDLAERVLDDVIEVQGLAHVTGAELCRLYGVGPVTAIRILAAVELGRRVATKPLRRGVALRCSDAVASAYGPRLAAHAQEIFIAIALDVRNRVISEHQIAQGTLTGVDVHPREVFRPLLKSAAAACLLLHNHPSGDPSPSEDDRRLCERLARAGDLVGVKVLDFVIVAGSGSYSFADRGQLAA